MTGGQRKQALLAVVAGLLLAALALAAMAAMRIGPFDPRTGFDIAPPPTITVSPTPGGTPSPATPSPAPATPQQPTATPTPSAQQTRPGAQLLGHIPSAMRDSCVLLPGSGGALAMATCRADGEDITVTYQFFATAPAMENAYDQFVDPARVEPGTGACANAAAWPAEGPYRIGEAETGRVLCAELPEGPSIVWTDTRLNILTAALSGEVDQERLFDFWTNDAGPRQ